MKTESQKRSWVLVAALWFALGCWSLLSPSLLRAQVCQSIMGYNAVWGTCLQNQQLEVVGSPAFIDASPWCGVNGCDQQDFCLVVNEAILANASFPNGVVVDARGVTYPLGGAETCTVNPFNSVTVPVTLLLPPEALSIQKTWVLPNNTRVVGTGRLSQLVATGTFTPDSSNPVEAMVEMGNASVCPSTGCTGISIEHIKLDGNNLQVLPDNVGLTGIYNGYAKDGSYVDDVELYRIGATSNSQSYLTTGLLIDTGAAGSGPYSKITIASVAATQCTDKVANECGTSGGNKGQATCTPTAAVQIRAATRGLHSITSTTSSDQKNGTRCAGPLAGIYLDASNNTIEDAHFEGFYDGIVVGANVNGQNAPVGNVISNVAGGFGGNSGSMVNMVHICSPQSQAGSACSGSSVLAKDLTILDTASIGSGALNMTTIKDDLTGTTVNSSPLSTLVAMYALGEPMGASQYSRFTTSLGSTNGSNSVMPTWAVGSIPLTNMSCSTPGALYSNTAGTGSGNSSNTLYICSQAGSWLLINNQ
jgi:hypothetical protein